MNVALELGPLEEQQGIPEKPAREGTMSVYVWPRRSILAGLGSLLMPSDLLARGLRQDTDEPGIGTTAVQIPYEGMRISAFQAMPRPAAERLPGIVIAHGCHGLDAFTQGLARRLAHAGYLVLAPDVLSLWGGTPDMPEAAAAMTQEFDPRDMTGIVAASVRFLGAHPAVSSPVALLGCEHGAWIAGQAATVIPTAQLGAVILFYGLPPRPSEVERILAPLQFHHAGRDARVGSEIPTLRTSLEQRKVPGEVLVYDTALSGFLDAGDAAYDAASADLAWTRTLTFLDATRVG